MVLVGHYHFGLVLGRGRFGWVSRATHQVVGHNVAIKHQPWAVGEVTCGGEAGEHTDCQHVEEDRWRAALENEVKLLSRISHPCVVALLEVVRKPSELYVCLEYLGDTTLAVLVSQHYEERNTGLVEPEASCIFKQVATGLQYLHSEGILHRDVKPENIMVIPSQHGEMPVAKLIDLGLAAAWDPSSPLNTSKSRVGTVAYLAPELTSSSCCYGPEIDVFSLGATLFYALTAEVPFTEYTRCGKRGTTALFGLQIQHEEALDLLSIQAGTMLRSMLQTAPELRWDLPRVLNHEWFLQEYSPESNFSTLQHLEDDDCDVFEKEVLSSIIGKDYFSVNDETDKDSDLSVDLVSMKSRFKIDANICNGSVGSISRQRIQSSCSESSVCSDQDASVNMDCVDRVSVLIQKDYDHVLEHLDKEPWGPVGGIYNLLLLAGVVHCVARS